MEEVAPEVYRCLRMQFEYQMGTKLPSLRTHGLYTGATHVPMRDELLVLDRPHEAVLMCTLQHFLGRSTASESSAGRLRTAQSEAYPFKFITRHATEPWQLEWPRQSSFFIKFSSFGPVLGPENHGKP